MSSNTTRPAGPWIASLDLVCSGTPSKRTVKKSAQSARRAIALARDPKASVWPAFVGRRCRVKGAWVTHEESGVRLPASLWAGDRLSTGTGARGKRE